MTLVEGIKALQSRILFGKIFNDFKDRQRLLNRKANSKAKVHCFTLRQLDMLKPNDYAVKIQGCWNCCYKNSQIEKAKFYTHVLEFQSLPYGERMTFLYQIMDCSYDLR